MEVQSTIGLDRLAFRVRAFGLPAAAVAGIIAGLILRLWGADPRLADRIWFVALVVTGLPVVWQSVREMFAGQFASDVVATLAIIGAAVLTQPFAGLVIVLMQSGGEALERFAEGRASAAVRALEQAAPRQAHRLRGAGLEDIAVDQVQVGDMLLVRPGEIVPCDGIVTEGHSHVDVSRLTGEPVPISAISGTHLMSGAVNQEGPLTLRASALARESQYARIVELVRSAQASKSPLQRVADRYAIWFTPLTLAVCAVAYLIERNPLRVLAVLVVATPCPLILATPVAVIGGINRAARRHIIVRNGGALEQLASVAVAVFDKTGTLTVGTPTVSRVSALDRRDEREILRLAAGVEQGSGHLLARSVVAAAVDRSIPVPEAAGVIETSGSGVSGMVEGHRVAVGSRSFVLAERDDAGPSLPRSEGRAGLRAYVSVDARPAGVIDFADQLRPRLATLFADLRGLGIERTMLLSGDQARYTQDVAEAVGIEEARGDLLPEDKVRTVRELVERGVVVMMVGDGTNDAPALSTASVGVALAGHGGGISAEAADVVILTDDVTRVADAIQISRRTLRIARQSIWAGLGLSGVAMVIAALGYIPPAVGAVLQECIDVAVILNALRASA